ncbi:MAG: DUF4915 domain-containing protein [Acidimicrobiales bacterium]
MPEPKLWQHELAGRRLLVSGFGKWGGGVYDLTSGSPVALDDLPTSGLALGGGRIWRVLRAPGEQTASCELFSYDERGVRSYQRLDAIRDPHDVCWHDGAVHITSSWDAVVWRLEIGTATDATPKVVWRGSPVPDSWHPNSLVVVDGRLHVCAFGRFDEYKAWKTAEDKRTGFVHDIERRVDVLAGLGHPHTPRHVGDRWYVCESTSGALVEYDLGGEELRRVAVRRFSRGLGIVGPWAFVGGNARRSDDDDRADIAIVDLASFEIVERIPMPCLEVYDIVAVPFGLARGLAIGFGANPARAVEQHRGGGRVAERQPAPGNVRVQLVGPRVAAKLTEPGQIVDRTTASRCRVYADLPAVAQAGEVRLLVVQVENRSKLALASVVPNPIRIGARWLPLDSGSSRNGASPDAVVQNPLAPLPRLVHPGETVDVEVALTAPADPGRYELRVTLHQPGFGWFGRRAQTHLDVTPIPATPRGGGSGTGSRRGWRACR